MLALRMGLGREKYIRVKCLVRREGKGIPLSSERVGRGKVY